MKLNYFFTSILLMAVILCQLPGYAQQKDSTSTKKDTMSKFDKKNAKMEALFQVIPVPIYSYSTDAGHTFGLAKFNLFELSKNDTISAASRLSEVATFSTEGRINISVSTDLNWHEGRYMLMGYINYKQQPEYFLGIGNDVSRDSIEKIELNRLKFVNYFLIQWFKNFYAGIGVDLTNYLDIKYDSTSYLVRNNVTGIEGGTGVGLGFSAAYDSRENRYNPSQGMFSMLKVMTFPSFLGNPYIYTSLDFDIRKYFNPWYKHVIALQGTTSYRTDGVPFYELSLMGGDDKMRGYYKGAIRDKVLIDAQLEYRMPIWKMLGATAFVGTGRVAPSYSEMSLDGLWLSYGLGLRLRVDTKHNTNLRFDWGFGPNGVNGFYISFAEAF